MSLDGSSASYLPYTINGLQEIAVDSSTVNTLQVNSLTPNRVVVADSSNYLISAAASTTEVDYLVGTTSNIQSQLNSKASQTYVDTNFLNKTTSTAQTVQASTTFLNGLTTADDRPAILGSRVVVGANYQSILTSADVSVGQYFGTITNVGSTYQSTSTGSSPPILVLFPITAGKRYTLTIEVLGDDSTYDTTLDIYQSQDNVSPYPNFNDAVLDSPVFAPASVVFHQTNATFVATTTGSVVVNLTTLNPSGISTVQWKNMYVYEMGVALTNVSLPTQLADRVAVINDKKQLVSSGISTTKLGYLDNVSSDLQNQLNGKLSLSGGTMTGAIDMGANKITTTYTPVNGPDLINKTYGDSAYATTAALAGYLPLTGGTLTGNFTVNGGTTTSLSGGMTIGTNTRATTAQLSGSTIGGTVSSATITTLPSPPPIYNITYSGSFYGGLLISFTPDIGRTYQYTFTKFYRQGLPGGIFTFEFLQDVGSLALPLAPATQVVPTSYAAALTYTGSIRPTTTGNVYLRFYSISVGAANFFWDSFTLTDITASITAPLALTQSISQSTINTTAEFAGGGLQVIQRDLGFTAAGFLTTSLPTGVQGGTITGPVSSYYRLTSLASQAEMAMRPNNFTPTVGERYSYTFCGIRSSVALTLQIVQATSIGVISTQPTTNNITVAEQSISGSFIVANNTLTFAFRFQAGSANPWVEWASFQLTRADTNTAGTLTSPNVYIGDGALPAANSAGITTLFNTGNICTNRNRLIFSNGSTDWNHCIYNNYRNLDNEGVFDGMKMNVYNGLQVRIGNAGGVVPTTAMSIDSAGRVGIGVISPDTTLYVNGKGKFYDGNVGIPAVGTNGGAGTRLILWPGSASETAYAVGINASTMWYGVPSAGTGAIHAWYQGTVERMRLVGNNLALNTTTPQGNLHVQLPTGVNDYWGKLVVKTTSFWGDGCSSRSETAGTQYATMYAMMFLTPHVVSDTDGWCHIRMGRSGGVSTGYWWEMAVRSDGWFQIGRERSSQFVIEPTVGWVGIGVQYPLAKLHLVGGICYIQNGDASKTLYGANATWGSYLSVGSGTNVITDGNTAQCLSTNGNLHLDAGYYRGIYLGYYPQVAGAPNVIYLYGNNINAYNNGALVSYTNAAGWINISDEREKEDIQDIKTSRSLERVLALKPKHYRRTYPGEVSEEIKNTRIIGFIAQEVKKTNPHCISEWDKKNDYDEDKSEEDTKRMGICYNDYVVHLVGAVQEQQKMIKDLQSRCEILEAREKVWEADAKQKEEEFAAYKEMTDRRLEQIVGLLKGLLDEKAAPQAAPPTLKRTKTVKP